MPTVAEPPFSRPSALLMSVYWVRMRPFSNSTTSKRSRRSESPKKCTLRHSMTNWRLGAAPRSWVRTLALPSTKRSSQNGYTAPLGGKVLGMAELPNVALGARKLRKPLVVTCAVL